MANRIFGSIVKESAFYMCLSGVLMGIIFLPVSRYILGLPSKEVFTLWYTLTSITAGLIVSAISLGIIKLVILNRLNSFSENIKKITENILSYKKGTIKSIDKCEDCYIRLYSKDVLGELAGRYNSLVRVIRSLFWQYERMDEFFEMLWVSLEMEKLDKNTANFICDIANGIGVEIYHLCKNDELKTGYSRNIHSTLTDSKKASLIDIIKHGKRIELKDNEVEIVEFGTGSIKPSHVIYFPFSHEDLSGVVVVYSKAYINSDRITLIERLLGEYLLALKSAISYMKMQQMAAFDELTGIYNRRFGLQRLREEYRRAKRMKGCLCVIMFDIDHFKRINDTYGHQAGDFVLAKFASILKSGFREEDVVMRYGGEEFLCGLSNLIECDAHSRAEQVRKAVEATEFKWKNTSIKITVSCGISGFDASKEEDKSIEEIIKEADEKLYIAKNTGRNRCVSGNNLLQT